MQQGALVGASVLLFAASFPPLGWQPLAWIALAPLFVAIRSGSTRGALAWTLLWGFAAAWSTGTWLAPAISNYFEQPVWVGHFFFLFVAGTMVGPYYVLFAAALRPLARRFSLALPWLTAAGWVAAELGRGRLFTGTPIFIGNPWGLLGYSQVGFDALMQVASLGGIYAVSFAVAAANAAWAQLWWERHAVRAAPARGLAILGVGLAPALLALAFGALELREADARTGAATKVAVVQGNLDLGARWRGDLYGENLGLYLELTSVAIDRHRPALVFWPEAAMTFFVDQEPAYRRAIGRVLGAGDVQLIAGAPRTEGEPRSARYFNTAFAFGPDGEIRGHYDKEYLVPFTEYFPFDVDFLRRQFGRAREFTHGGAGPPLPTRAGGAGIAICNEAMLPEVVSARVARGAEYLVNPSNDSWLADEQYSEMQFDVVVVRAIEQRRALVRASTSGPSAVVDPWGRVQVRSEPLTRSVIVGEIRGRTDRTLYSRVGDAFALACLVAVGLGWLWARR